MSNFKLSKTEELCFCTTRIECSNSELNKKSTGTGFFFRFKKDDYSIPLLITNRHVIRNNQADSGTFRLHVKSDFTNPLKVEQTIQFTISEGFQEMWVDHPDPEVDLCAMPLGILLAMCEKNNINPFYVCFVKEAMIKQSELEEIDVVEELLMVGYPNGLWDKKNNLPLFRKGISSSHINVNYNSRKEFVVDMACFEGSSGSPILIYNQNGFINKKEEFYDEPRQILVGILYGGPNARIQGETSQKPGRKNLKVESKIPMNMGYAIHINAILDFEEVFTKKIKTT